MGFRLWWAAAYRSYPAPWHALPFTVHEGLGRGFHGVFPHEADEGFNEGGFSVFSRSYHKEKGLLPHVARQGVAHRPLEEFNHVVIPRHDDPEELDPCSACSAGVII